MEKTFTMFEAIVLHTNGSRSKFISSMEGWDTNIAKKMAKKNDWAVPVKYVESVLYLKTEINKINNEPK